MSDFVVSIAARFVFSVLAFGFAVAPQSASAQSGGGSVGPLMKLLQSGKLPAARKPTVVEMICTRGEPDDLAVILKQTIAGEFDAPLMAKVLQLLTDAVVVRKVKPSGD